MLFDRKTIRWKLFTYYFLLFAVFTLSIIFYQNKREKHFRIAQIETTLNEYTDLTHRYSCLISRNDVFQTIEC